VIRSMTGFGRGETSLGGVALSVEIRSVNARHCDVRVRSPRELASLESQIRSQVAGRFARGTLDVSIRFGSPRGGESRIEIDLETARGYVQAARTLAQETGLAEPLSVEALLAMPGVAKAREQEIDEEQAGPALKAAVDAACDETLAMRAREGQALERELRARSTALAGILSEIESRADEVVQGLRARLEKRIAALAPELALTPGRIEQEVVIYADRMDVTEEVVRFRSHLEQFHETLALQGPAGRKLEFILQELSRETNTIGSKAADAPIAKRVVELKTELEKLREQVLNVE
jgi:uncharacterized protein (TIGR00255 family)